MLSKVIQSNRGYKGVTHAVIVTTAFSLAALFSSPWFLIAVGLYGLSTILWVFILVRLPLTVAYPFTLLGAALVPMAACYLFGETLSTRAWLGFALILVGLYIANSK